MENHKKDFIAVTTTKEYFTVVAAGRRLFPTITATNYFWLFTATGEQILIVYLLKLLKRKKEKLLLLYLLRKKYFATDAI